MARETKRSSKLILSLLLILAMIIPSMNMGAEAATMKFTDVPASAWYTSSVKYCYEHGYMNGTNTEQTLFAPSQKLNRGMMVSILWNMAGRPAATKTTKFTDITNKSAYYYKAVQWAAEKKVVSGYADGSFGPSKEITREQLACMLNNFAKYRGKDTTASASMSAFKDASKIGSYAEKAVSWAVAHKIISGKSNGTLVDPKGNATRAEAAAMVKSYCDNVESGKVVDTGKVLNILSWNDEFAYRLLEYPGFVPYSSNNPTKGGTIDGVKVNFILTPNFNDGYQQYLDDHLNAQITNADDIVDIFLMEPDYMYKYLDNSKLMNLNNYLSASDTKNMYQYTKDLATNSKGELKAVTWQITPSVFAYNRMMAIEMFGNDDPDYVQTKVKDWSTFLNTADKVKMYGYYMTGTYHDTMRSYLQNRAGAWVQGGKIVLDPVVKNWINDTKRLYDRGLTTANEMWSAEWTDILYYGGTFGYFGPDWFTKYCTGFWEMDESSDVVANRGEWAVTVGPQSSYWGGSFIAGNAKSDNKNLIVSILKKLTCDEKTLESIQSDYDDIPNNMAVMGRLAKSDYSVYVLGGMNPMGVYDKAAKNIKVKPGTKYDFWIEEVLRQTCKEIMMGYVDYETGINQFYENIQGFHPELKR